MSRHYFPKLNEVFNRSCASLLHLEHCLTDVFRLREITLEEIAL